MSGATVQVGNVEIPGRVFLAPLAGFTDLPFRQICRKLGAAYAVAEMVASQKHLRESRKSQERFSLGSESYPRAIQLLGSDPVDLADTARYAVQCGAQIVDFNCGCPAKKVCSVECGSALLKDEALVEKLLKALTEAVDVPVTLKYRLGWDAEHINALNIAAIAQEAGIKMLVLHGRTREQGFKGEVDYQRIAEVKASVDIPVIAIGNPWIFSQINDKLDGRIPQAPSKSQLIETIGEHLQLHFSFYEKEKGLKTIRKHLSGYFKRLDLCPTLLTDLYSVTDPIQLEKNVELLLRDNLD